MKRMQILGIETSCDETGIAVYDSQRGVLGHSVYAQLDLHNQFGGVVPELASRDQIRKTTPMIRQLLADLNLRLQDIDGVAYTIGPGLAGALMVGATIGRSLAYALNIPGIGVHHMEAHLLAPMLENPAPEFPFLSLLVSGGHTMLVKVDGLGKYQTLGESLDDAAGEAFDKTAKLLGLNYPGGPQIARAALKGQLHRFTFPRPMMDRPGLDFSFSGLKTYAANTFYQHANDPHAIADIALAFEEAVVDTLVMKCKRAIKETKLNQLVMAGGVTANLKLRERMDTYAKASGVRVFFPRPEFCTDNGAMVAYAGCQHLLRGEQDGLEISIRPRWPLEDV